MPTAAKRRRLRQRAWIAPLVLLLAGWAVWQRWLADRPALPREIAQRSFPSVVVVTLHDQRGKPVSQGSGFVLTRGIVATTYHLVEGATDGYVTPLGKRDVRLKILGVAAHDKEHDLALLAVEGLDAPALELADSRSVFPGDRVYAVGNPEGLDGTFSDGLISARRDEEGGSLLQLTAPISPGSSGGPVLDAEGRVVGIAAGGISDGQNLNFAIPSEYLEPLVASAEKASLITLAELPPSKPPMRVSRRSAGGSTVAPVRWLKSLFRSFRRVLP